METLIKYWKWLEKVRLELKSSLSKVTDNKIFSKKFNQILSGSQGIVDKFKGNSQTIQKGYANTKKLVNYDS